MTDDELRQRFIESQRAAAEAFGQQGQTFAASLLRGFAKALRAVGEIENVQVVHRIRAVELDLPDGDYPPSPN